MTRVDFAAEIHSRVSVPDAIAMYTPRPEPRRNRIPCPVHGGTNYNLGYTNSVYHCFVCGDGGDLPF